MKELIIPKTKLQYYDNLRAFACFLVILTHSAMPALSPEFGIFMVFFSIVSSPSSELFISISSGLLAPTKMTMIEFYKVRFSKLLWPFLFWSVFMVAYRYVTGHIDEETAIQRVLFFPLQPTEGVYWFVYAICGLYLINPIISPWLSVATKKEFHFILALWVITLLLPYLNIVMGKEVYKINGNYFTIFAYIGGFAGYMLMGVYFKKFPYFFESKWRAIFIVIGFVILGTAPVLWSYVYNRSAIETVTSNLSITSAFYVSAIFIFFKNFELPSFVQYFLSKIAKYSFGIYLIHILIVREVVWKFLENNRMPHPIIETPFIAIISLIICMILVKFISLLPKSKYIIGI